MSDGINEQDKPVTQFYSAQGDALTPEQVEDEVLEAVKEGQETTVEVKQEETLKETASSVVEKAIEEATKESEEEGNKPTPQPPYVPPKKVAEDAVAQRASRNTVKRLRLRDTPSKNKTCSVCCTRVPLNQINGGHADVCDTCKG